MSFSRRSSATGNHHQHCRHLRRSLLLPLGRQFLDFLLFFAIGLLLGFAFFPSNSSSPHKLEIIRPDFPAVAAVKDELPEFQLPKSAVPEKKLLIIITPTSSRAMQAQYLVRLGQTLRLVEPPLVWVVIETGEASDETAEVLMRSGVTYRHVVCQKNISSDVKDMRVFQRNAALEYVERHRLDGIVYFAEEDNVHSLELFDRLRDIRRFGAWPVAMVAQGKNKAIFRGPFCNGSKVIGWQTNESNKRFTMSSFAFNSTILWDPKRWKMTNLEAIRQSDNMKKGFQETAFVERLVEDESQMECLPRGGSKVMNWHVRLEAENLVYPKGWHLSKNLDSVISSS